MNSLILLSNTSLLSESDFEFHLFNAYCISFNQAYSWNSDGVPNIWDILDNVSDLLYSSGRHFFYSEVFGYKVPRKELSIELVEMTLDGMKAEFIDVEGNHRNDCQTKLFDGWEKEWI